MVASTSQVKDEVYTGENEANRTDGDPKQSANEY